MSGQKQKRHYNQRSHKLRFTFSHLQRTRNSGMRKHHYRYTGIFSNSEKRFSLLHAQVNGKCLILRIRV